MAATPMTAEARRDPERNESYLRNVPLRRWGSADEIAERQDGPETADIIDFPRKDTA